MFSRSFRRKILGVVLQAISISGAMAQELPKFMFHSGIAQLKSAL